MTYFVYYDDSPDEYNLSVDLKEFDTKKEALDFVISKADPKNPDLSRYTIIKGEELKLKVGKVIERIEGIFYDD